MPTIVVPDGVALKETTSGAVIDPVASNRSTDYRFDLLDRTGALTGQLRGVSGGSVSWTANSAVKGGGKISVNDTGDTPDWTKVRIRPVLLIEGMDETPLGLFVPSAPVEDWSSTGRSWSIELLDRSSIIQQDCVDASYSIAAGANVIAEVKKVIRSTGEDAGSITASGKTLKNGLVWKAGTSKLTIVNDLLEAAGYFSLWVDGTGQFRIEKYVEPAKRGIVYELLDDTRSIYTPDFSLDNDIYSVPNKVIAIAQGDGETEGVVGVATNEKADSPFSYQSRGRWIVDVKEGVEIADDSDPQTAINSYAKRRLASLSAPAMSVEIQHAPVPNLSVNSVVRFRRTPAALDTRFTVSKTTIDFDPTSLAKSTLSDVANVEDTDADTAE